MLFLGWMTYLFHVICSIIVHSSPFLCVRGDDQMIRYLRADDLTGGPRDA